ncbi:MAG: protein kinase [Myxococcales bacterium]|nr:protein kinase [Myxococcales bacterium]
MGTLVGSEIDGRYRIVRRLGVGGMGAVYEAEHIDLGRRVAVKVLQSTLCTSEKYRKRFLREAKAASAIDSDHIVKTFDFGATEDGMLYFTMEMLEGQDLEQYLKESGPVSWDVLEPMFFQVFDALHAAHSRGVIHRDIKPSNCFLCSGLFGGGPLVKVLDFGIAKIDASLASGEDPIATVETLTSTNEMFGTVAYMAPELIEGRPADVRSDVYAVGVMLFRALVGQLPFSGLSAFKIFEQHVNAPVPSLRAQAPSVSAAVESVVFRAMAKNPDHRYQSIAELQKALVAARAGVLEPSIAALSGRTEAVQRDGLPRTERWVEPTSPGDSISTQPPIDSGSVQRPIPGRSRLATLMTLAVVAAGSAGLAVWSSRPDEPRAEPRTAQVVERAPRLVEPQAPPPPTAPASEQAVTPAASPPADDHEPAVDGEASGSTGAVDVAAPEDVPAPAPPSKKRRRSSRTVVGDESSGTASKPPSFAEQVGAQCPGAVGDRFTLEGMVGSDGRYSGTIEVRGGPSKAVRECIESQIRSKRLFPSGGTFRHEKLVLTPR